MKAIVALGLICLLAVHSANATEGLLSRHVRDTQQCSWNCSSQSSSSSSNWLVKIEIKAGIYIVYNADSNYFGIYNKNLNFAIIIYGKGYLGVFNTSTSAGLLINLKTNVCLYVSGSTSVTQFNSDSTVYAGFEVLFQIIVSNESNLTGNQNTNSGNYFLITDLIFALKVSVNISISSKFNTRLELAKSLQAQFSAIFTIINKSIASGAAEVAAGAGCLISGILDLSETVSTEVSVIAKFSVSIIVTLKGQITASLIATFQKAIVGSAVALSAAVELIVSAIEGVGCIYKDVSAAVVAIQSNTVSQLNTTYITLGNIYYRFKNTIQKDKSWLIDIENTANSTTNGSLTISYSVSNNYLVIINKDIQYAIVFSGGASYYALYNCNSGVGIAVNFLIGYGIYVDTNATLIAETYASGDYVTAALQMANVVSSTHITISEALNGNIFLFSTVIQNIAAHKSYSYLLIGKATLSANLSKYFTKFFNLIAALNTSERNVITLLLEAGFSSYNLTNFKDDFVSVVTKVFGKLSGYFNSNLLVEFYAEIKIYIDLKGAVSGLFKTLLTALDGIKSTITSFAGAVSSIVSIEGSFSASASLGLSSNSSSSSSSNSSVSSSSNSSVSGGHSGSWTISVGGSGGGSGGVSVGSTTAKTTTTTKHGGILGGIFG